MYLLIFIFTQSAVFLIFFIIYIRFYSVLKHYKKLQEDFKSKKDEAEAIINSMGEGLLVFDTNFKIKLINHSAERILETTSNQALNQEWKDLVQAYIGDKEIDKDERSSVIVLNTGKIIITTIGDNHFYKIGSGRKFPVTSVTAPLRTDDHVIGIVKVFRDVTREKEADRMKVEFISLASHQLRTPLSAIKWFSELLLDGNSGTLLNEQKEFVEKISGATERMIELVSSLLNISRIESGRIRIAPKPTDLIELVNTVCQDLSAQMNKRKQQLIISTHEKIPLINIDARMIRHVYMNLISNAIKYSPPGGQIMVIISRKDGSIISQISDNGYGIPEREQTKIFQKFFRAENAIKKDTEGSGLGLYLAKAIVNSSRGRIWFKSNENTGTSFWFSLPIVGTQPKEGEVSLDS